jgi:hypothetical protein
MRRLRKGCMPKRGGTAETAVKKLAGTVATTVGAGTGVAVCGWSAAIVLIVAILGVIFIVWLVLSNSDRSMRLMTILNVISNCRR